MATCAAWYQRANWTMAVINNSSSGMTNTVCKVADPPSSLGPGRIGRLLAAGGDVVGLVGHLEGDDGHRGDCQGGQAGGDEHGLDGGAAPLVVAGVGEVLAQYGPDEAD